MIELEKLYDCAAEHLVGEMPDWEEFADSFEAIFDAKMALYSPPSGADGPVSNQLISTTSPELMAEYFEKKIYEFDAIIADHPNPLEPTRRTEAMSDEEFREYPAAKKFLLRQGVFFIMVVYAILPDGSYLMLFVWRNENKSDFSDIEKQRMALFMRYLATFVATTKPSGSLTPDSAVIDFGKKYSLTDAEVEILSSLLQGKSLRNIADESSRSYGTVRWHVHNILDKCQVKSQQHLLSEFYCLIKS